ncbi:MAG: sigma-70 family RNA polymerase sigma factor [Odoribacteraceae bacterium]|jgi:RNA polymerase sigma-70 factor (ECF subfamily)|nr:sigma-70 family RNA polymerase sigma factor [Odoribacteraceae bacterium]
MYTHDTHEQTTKDTINNLTPVEEATLYPPDDTNTSLDPRDLEALRGGCHKVYRKLYLQFFAPLTRYITMTVRSTTLAEEFAQEIMATVWINRQKIDPEKNIKGYLFTVARHAITSYYRKQKVRENYLLQCPGEEYCSHSTDSPMIAKDIEQCVATLVDRMPKQRKKIFELSYKNGWSSGEIAQHLGLNQKNVEKQISYARKTIREKISPA